MSGFPTPVDVRDDSITESGMSTNSPVKRSYLISPYEGTTWHREIPIYNYVFTRSGPKYDSPDRKDFLETSIGLTPQMVNLIMYNRQMERANQHDRNMQGRVQDIEPFDPLFQMREPKMQTAFVPAGVTDTPAEELKRILGSMGNERIINIIAQGQVHCANYWGNDVCAGYHLFFVLKMLDLEVRNPVFHVSFGGSPAIKVHPNPKVRAVPHWFAVAVSDKKYIDHARKFTYIHPVTGEPTETMTDAYYVGQCFYNENYDKSFETNQPTIVERPIFSQEFTTSQKHMEVLLFQKV